MLNIISSFSKEFKLSAKILLRSPIINYYKTSFPRNALVSYITYPFRKGLNLSHTNTFEATEIARALQDAGFNVDIADYDYKGFINYSRYDLIFGFGEPLVNSFYKREKKIITIYYGTGLHIHTQNNNSLGRIKEVYNKKGAYLPQSGRIVDKAWSIQTTLVDAMILLGNLEAAKTYSPYFTGKTYNIPAMFLEFTDYKEIVNSKIFDQAKRHFLWFGSSGMIHKGLDLLLEIFSGRRDIYLHICGPLNKEPDFQRTYYNELNRMPNIHYYGFISLKSEIFKELLQKCAFVIFPSCSEGGSPSVLNICGNGGLIPLISKEATIDVHDYGFIFDKINHDSIRSVIDHVIQMENKEITEMSIKCGKEVTTTNSLDNYKNELRKCINEIVSG
ncbi:MAG: glycosyltransferase [Ignavibacteriaceae bacterium]|nr:glycosyltransferase [Ignavibacteriaceae bacterium]